MDGAFRIINVTDLFLGVDGPLITRLINGVITGRWR